MKTTTESLTETSEGGAIERDVANLRRQKDRGLNSSFYARSSPERVAAQMKSYVGASVVVFLLYWLFWLPGFIVNIIYYNDVKNKEKIAGQSLPGVGCLSFMMYFQYAALASFFILILVIAILTLSGPQIANIFSKITTGLK